MLSASSADKKAVLRAPSRAFADQSVPFITTPLLFSKSLRALRGQKSSSPCPSVPSVDKKDVLRVPPRPPRTKSSSSRPFASLRGSKGQDHMHPIIVVNLAGQGYTSPSFFACKTACARSWTLSFLISEDT